MDREVQLSNGRTSPTGGRRGLGVLLGELVEGTAELVRHEVRLIQVELGNLAVLAARGSFRVAAGSVLLLLGGLAILVGLVFLIGEPWIVGRYWLAALIVSVLSGIVAAIAASRGARLFSVARLRPAQTLETLKEDAEWLTRQMQSDATSK
jgi:hypothetical protein